NHEGVDDVSREIWLAPTPEAFVASLRAWGARYLMVTNAGGSIIGLLLHTPYEAVRKAPDVPGGVIYMPGIFRFPAFRLDAAGGLSPEIGQLQPRFVSSEDRPLAMI